MTSSRVAQAGKVIDGTIADDNRLNVRYARERDTNGFPIVKGEPVLLAGEEWLIPVRRADFKLVLSDGVASLHEQNEDLVEAEYLKKMHDEVTVAGFLMIGAEFVGRCLQMNYKLDDSSLMKILNSNINETEAAIEAAAIIRFNSRERGDFVFRMMRLGQRWAAEYPAETAQAADRAGGGPDG